MSTKFSKKFEKFSNAENYFQNRRKSTLFRALSSAFGGMKNCRPSGNSVSRQKFFIFLQRCYASTSCTLPRPSLRMERALRSGRWDSFSAEKPRRLKHATGMFLRAAFRIPPSVKNKDHPDGWSLFWRRRWDSNPRGVLPPTRFRVFYSQHTLADFEKKCPILRVNALVRKKWLPSPFWLLPTVRNARELSERTNRTAIKHNNRKSP